MHGQKVLHFYLANVTLKKSSVFVINLQQDYTEEKNLTAISCVIFGFPLQPLRVRQVPICS